MRTHIETIKEAEELRKKMKGKGWKIDVWENLGWHYCVFNGPLAVFPGHGAGYFPMLSDEADNHGGTPVFWSIRPESFKDPNKAVQAQIKKAKRFANKCSKIVELIENI